MDETLLIVAIMALIVLLFLTIIALFLYSGVFTDIRISAGPPPVLDASVVYKFGRGPYKDCGKIFTEVTAIAPKLKSFGVYYDDPKQTPPHRLRWAVGCVLAEGGDRPDLALQQTFHKEDFKDFRFPLVTNAVMCSFPHRTMLSVFIGIYRVYPELGDYIKKQKLCAHPFLELYGGEDIQYMAPLSRQSEFYVPETSADYVEVEPSDSDSKPSTSALAEWDTCSRKIDPEVCETASIKPDEKKQQQARSESGPAEPVAEVKKMPPVESKVTEVKVFKSSTQGQAISNQSGVFAASGLTQTTVRQSVSVSKSVRQSVSVTKTTRKSVSVTKGSVETPVTVAVTGGASITLRSASQNGPVLTGSGVTRADLPGTASGDGGDADKSLDLVPDAAQTSAKEHLQEEWITSTTSSETLSDPDLSVEMPGRGFVSQSQTRCVTETSHHASFSQSEASFSEMSATDLSSSRLSQLSSDTGSEGDPHTSRDNKK